MMNSRKIGKEVLQGLDEISLTLQHADEIKAFEDERIKTHPWLFNEH